MTDCSDANFKPASRATLPVLTDSRRTDAPLVHLFTPATLIDTHLRGPTGALGLNQHRVSSNNIGRCSVMLYQRQSISSVPARMIVLVDTERQPQQALDRAASCILTDRSLPCPRASWQQCTCCDEWIEESNIEYTFTCTIGIAPAPTFQLKTRYPAYTCPGCVGALHKHAGAPAGDSSDDEGEAEQLCPLHVQAVYALQGSHIADNMGAITKGFHVHCPDCKFVSRLLRTPAEVRNFVQQHLQFSKGCIKLKQALAAGTYDSPAAFGASSSSSSSNKVQPEKIILELLSRLVVMTACHIVSATRPPPTPVDKLSGEARRIAAAIAHIKSRSKGEFTPEGQQLLPYRLWAVNALSLDSELLTEANWVRPSLAGLALEHKPSLLDLVLAPPYIAVAEHDAGMTVDKLAVLLLREQQQHKNSSLHRVAATSAAAGGDQLPAAVAATEAALSELLSADAVFQYVSVQQRVQQFLDLSGIPGLGDVVCALAQPHVAGRGPQNRHLAVCAVCGMTPAALQQAKQSHALHRCKYCIVSTCQPCRQEQQEQQRGAADTAPADELCLWCQGHPDTQDLDVGTLSGTSGSRDKQQQQQRYIAFSSPECSVDQAAAAVVRGVKRRSVSSLGAQQQQVVSRRISRTAAVDDDHPGTHHRLSHDYDLGIEMAPAAEATDGHGSQLTVAANSKLQQEMEDLQQMQAELQSAVESLGIQGLQVPLAPAPPLKPQDSSDSKHGLPLDSAVAPGKRQRLVEQQQQQLERRVHLSHPVAVPASDASGDHIRSHQLPQQQQQQHLMTIRSPSPSGPVDPKRARAPPVPRCGQCKTCNNLQLRKGCAVNRRRYAQGLPFIVPRGADRIPRSVAKQHALAAARGSTAGSSGPAAPVGNEITGLLLSSAGFRPVSNAAAAGHGSSSGDAAAAGQASDAINMLVGAGFTAANMARPAREHSAASGRHHLGESDVRLDDQNDHRHHQHQHHRPQQLATDKRAAAANATRNPKDLLESLNQQIDGLCADISDWCSSNLAADHADVDKTLQVIQELKEQLWDNCQQTGQQLFISGLEILGEIVGAFAALPAAGAKVVLACNCQRRVSGACCPDNQPCSVLELIMCCWLKEMQGSRVTAAESDCREAAAAADGSARQSSGVVKQQEAIRSGQCQAALRLIAQLSSLQYQVYYGPLAAGAELQQIEVHKDVAVALRDAVIHVMSGTALLMLQGPEVESAQECSRWGALSAEWQQCLLQCKWAVTSKPAVGSAGSAVVSVLRELGRVVDQLTALKANETSDS